MASETVVAVFNTADEAQNAIRALEATGVPSTAIQHYRRDENTSYADESSTGDSVTGDSVTGGARQGFWSWLLGEEGGYQDHRTVYERTYESGGTVVTVIVPQDQVDRVVSTLEAHNPVDLDERASQYSSTGTTATTGVGLGAGATGSTVATDRTGSGAEQVVQLAEENLQVGKRTVDKGAARVRRYVVERPVEEQIRLRNETVSVQRRPVSGSATVATDAFTDKVVEVKETAEEAVVSKTARVVEEVVIGKEATERTETVRDTVRREEVEVDDAARSASSVSGGTSGTSSGTRGTGTSGTGTSGTGAGGAGLGTGTGTAGSGTGTRKP
jgi:uncharacterized protein (TIGR02271 family)